VPYADLTTARVHYEVRGDSEKTVVFSHGFLMDHTMFDAQVEALSGTYRCVAWDERGHGATRATSSFSYWDSARDLLELLDHLAVPDAVLVGMSQGGFLSLRAALLAPARVRALAFLDSQAGPEDPALRPAYDALFELWQREGPSDDVAQMVAATILGDAEPAPWIEKWKALPLDQVRHVYETLVGREDLHQRLGEITCPALVLHGTADPAIPLAKARALCAGLAGCDEVAVVEGGGHAVNLTHPAEVTAALAAFLARVWETADRPTGRHGHPANSHFGLS
jgi:3-oxoadipate enol-lactonase